MKAQRGCGVALACLLAVALACGSESIPPTFSPYMTSTPLITAHPDISPMPELGSTPSDVPVNAPSDLPTVVPTSAPGHVGVRLVAGGAALTINKVWGLSQIDEFTQAAASNVFVIADVTAENVSMDTLHYNPLDFRVKDSDGFEYDSGFSAPDPTLKFGDLSKGSKARGNVGFEVPRTAKGLVVTFRPAAFGDLVISISIGDAPQVK